METTKIIVVIEMEINDESSFIEDKIKEAVVKFSQITKGNITKVEIKEE